MIKLNRTHLVIIIAVMAFIQACIFTQGGVFGLLSIPTLPKSFLPLYEGLFQYQPLSYPGQLNFVYPPPLLPINAFGYLLDIIFGDMVAFIVATFLPIFIAAAGMLYLILELLDGSDYAVPLALGGSALMIFAVVPFSVYWFMTFVPATLFFMLEIFKDANKNAKVNPKTAFWLALVLSLQIAFSNYTAVVGEGVFFLVFFAAMLPLARRGTRQRIVKVSAMAVAIALIINSNLITSSYLLYMGNYAQYFNGASQQLAIVYANQMGGVTEYLKTLFGFSPQNIFLSAYLQTKSLMVYQLYPKVSLLYPISYGLIPFFILLLVLSSLFYLHNKKGRRLDLKQAFVLSIFVAFVAIGLLANTYSAPLGPAFVLASSWFPALLTLRIPSLSLFQFLLVSAILLAAVGANFLLCRMKPSRRTKNVFLAALLAFVLLYAYVYDLQHIMPGISTSLPQYVNEISGSMNSQGGDFTIATLPQQLSSFSTNWYLGTDIYAITIFAHPVLTGGSSLYTQYFVPPAVSYYLNATSAFSSNAIKYDASNLFGIFGVKYIIVQGDALNSPLCVCIVPFSFNAIYANLNAGGFIRVANYSNSSIYENPDYVPLVYATNIYNYSEAYSNESTVIDAISSSKFDIQHYSVLDYCAACVQLNSIPGFSAPAVAYTEENPSTLRVNISNATSPFYLIFRNSYSTNWTAQYDNGSAIPQGYHAEANGFANAWYVNRTGSYTLTLYYTPQTIGYISWVVSILGLAALVLLGTKAYKTSMTKHARTGG